MANWQVHGVCNLSQSALHLGPLLLSPGSTPVRITTGNNQYCPYRRGRKTFPPGPLETSANASGLGWQALMQCLYPLAACSCGRRLCEEVTGECLCPARTVRPQCEVCETNSFSFHPLAGCEVCNCSRKGTIEAAISACDRDTGQCR